eukprot:COSAG02_NODE_4470_length_5330_cov_25.203785_7_plen_129_part_00
MQNCSSAILASAILDGPPAFLLAFCVNTRPSMSSVSSIVPPTFLTICNSTSVKRTKQGASARVCDTESDCRFDQKNFPAGNVLYATHLKQTPPTGIPTLTRISRKSTLVAVAGSITFNTASTAIGASR